MVQTELTQREILEKDFSSKLRGYDPQEVDEFLDIIIRDYKAFDAQIEELKQENERVTQNTSKIFKRLEAVIKKNEALKQQVDELQAKNGGSVNSAVKAESSTSAEKEASQVESDESITTQVAQNTEQTKAAQDEAGQNQSSQVDETNQETRASKGPASVISPVLGGRKKSETSQSQTQAQASNSDSTSRPSRSSATIIDILKRLSNLERAVFGEENDVNPE